jgi:hypothetical protein
MNKMIGVAIALVSVIVAANALHGQQAAGDGPRYQNGTELVRPADYREWPFLGAGLGLTYDAERGPGAQNAPQNFSNVFVNPSSYRHFMQTGTWKDGTVFVLEIRASATGTAPNTTGRFQAGMVALEAEVKDAKLPNGWAYYEFGRGNALRDVAAPLTGQREAGCVDCHTKHTAVERTFVQFYPHLLDVAKAKGTVKAGY